MEITRTLDTAHSVMDCLDDSHIDYIIAGGYSRDMTMQHTPKDLDIIVYNLRGNYKSFEYAIQRMQFEFDVEVSLIEQRQEYLDDWRVNKVYTVQDNIDIIVWTEEYTTPLHVIADFDFNFNQYSTTWINQKETHRFHGFEEGTLRMIRNKEEVPDHRWLNMILKAKDRGWNVKEEEDKYNRHIKRLQEQEPQPF